MLVQRERTMPKTKLHYCEIDDGSICPECCDHGDVDDCQCLDCGTDLTEELSTRAYDRAKDFQKYGE